MGVGAMTLAIFPQCVMGECVDVSGYYVSDLPDGTVLTNEDYNVVEMNTSTCTGYWRGGDGHEFPFNISGANLSSVLIGPAPVWVSGDIIQGVGQNGTFVLVKTELCSGSASCDVWADIFSDVRCDQCPEEDKSAEVECVDVSGYYVSDL